MSHSHASNVLSIEFSSGTVPPGCTSPVLSDATAWLLRSFEDLVAAGTSCTDLKAFERDLEEFKTCLGRMVMRQAIEGRDEGAASIERDGVVYRRVAPTPKTVMTLSGAA